MFCLVFRSYRILTRLHRSASKNVERIDDDIDDGHLDEETKEARKAQKAHQASVEARKYVVLYYFLACVSFHSGPLSRKNGSNLDMSIEQWYACMTNYQLAVTIVGCASVSPSVIINHVNAMSMLSEQINRGGLQYKPIFLVCVFLCFPFVVSR